MSRDWANLSPFAQSSQWTAVQLDATPAALARDSGADPSGGGGGSGGAAPAIGCAVAPGGSFGDLPFAFALSLVVLALVRSRSRSR